MICKKILLPVLIGSAFYLGACGGDDSPNSPVINPTPSSVVVPLPTSSVVVPPPLSSAVVPPPLSSAVAPVPASSASVTPPPTPVANYAPLATSANPAVATTQYALWQSFHFVTQEAETATYPSIAGEFGEVFTAAYVPAGRVVWSSQSGYYKNSCSVMDAAIAGMKLRACTVSEGIGYGMLLAYFNNDYDSFNRMWNYSRAFRAYNNVKLMPWITKSFHWEQVDNSSATDADEDIATSLILMSFKMLGMGNTDAANLYLADALTFVNAIWEKEVNPTTLLIYSGDQDAWKVGNPAYNLSYFSPVAIRLFAAVDPNHNWKGVLDAMYAYMQLVQSKGTSVFPDWSDATGNAIDPKNGSADNTYWQFNKESVRIPWRIAWDYYWYQDARAGAILKQLNDFISKKANGDPNNMALAVNYSWNLSVGADYTKNTVVSSQWYAAWCATGIAGNAAWLNTCTTGVNGKTPTNSSSSYFSDILLALYSALLNGLYVRPAGV